jgi:hypothetical protein
LDCRRGRPRRVDCEGPRRQAKAGAGAGNLHGADVEHDGAKVIIAKIEASSPGEAFYDAKITVLSEMIKHHVKEEEKPGEGFFAQARKGGVDLEALGARMTARKKMLLAQIKRAGLPAPRTRTFVGHKLGRTRPLAA